MKDEKGHRFVEGRKRSIYIHMYIYVVTQKYSKFDVHISNSPTLICFLIKASLMTRRKCALEEEQQQHAPPPSLVVL